MGDCVITSGGSIGWVCTVDSWGAHTYRFSGNLYDTYARMIIKYYLPNWSIPVEKHSYVKYKGELFEVTNTELDKELNVWYHIISPYKSEGSYYLTEGFEPVELSPPKPVLGEGKYLLAKSLCGRYNFLHINPIGFVGLTSGNPIDIDLKSPAFTFEMSDTLPTQKDSVLSNFTVDQVHKALEKPSYSQITDWLYEHFYEEIKDVPYSTVRTLLTSPRQSTIDRTAIALYQNSKKLDTTSDLYPPRSCIQVYFP